MNEYEVKISGYNSELSLKFTAVYYSVYAANEFIARDLIKGLYKPFMFISITVYLLTKEVK